jgi:hypothetical protein
MTQQAGKYPSADEQWQKEPVYLENEWENDR